MRPAQARHTERSAVQTRQILLVAAAMLAFAGNSLLCRAAFRTTTIDPASFTTLRLIAGALTLWCLIRANRRTPTLGGNWPSAAALFAYAAAFSFAYTGLPTGTGALLLFGAVQAGMIAHALWSGDRLGALQTLGLAAALAGLVALVLPGLTAPSPPHAALMVTAGLAFAIYSIRGRAPGDPTAATAGNFLRAVPLALALSLAAALTGQPTTIDAPGATYAILSGALASGLGYAIWYTALRGLAPTTAATVQLSVPVLAAFGAVLLLGEPITPRLLLSSTAILGGIALVILRRPLKPAA